MPSKLASIPISSVETDARAYAIVRATCKHYDNLFVCEALLRKANKCFGERNPNRFRAYAYRRAAVVLASADVNLVNEKTDFVTLINQGMPKFASTTDYALDCIQTILFEKKIQWNDKCIFPCQWWDRVDKEKQLASKALNSIERIIKMREIINSKPGQYYNVYKNKYSMTDHDDDSKHAYSFYNRMNTQQLNLIKPRFVKYY
jgi:hypothetical protein